MCEDGTPPTNNAISQYDVIVIGGGPAGATVASFVAMKGHRVLLLERERFPRHQVGESLLPATINGICPMLGITKELEDAGFTRKIGGTYRWGSHPEPWSFTFGPSSHDPETQAFAYQVERAKFDALLLTNASRLGVEVQQQCTARGLIEEQSRVTGVEFESPAGVSQTATAHFVVNASGNATSLSKGVGERIYSRFFQNVALYGYYRGAKRLPSPREGNILCEAFADGWFWFIPLSEELTSVGAVVSKDHARMLQQDPSLAMATFIGRTQIISEYLEPAIRVTEGIYGQFRTRKDYSYCNTNFWKPGVLLIGDAACFIDPVFSSGVHLATYSALLAARSINSCLEGTLTEQRAFVEFETRYRREFGRFYEFLVAFYDMDKDVDSYFWEARRILNTEERSNDAFIRLVAGTSETGEPLFRTASEYFDSRVGAGESFRQAYEGAADPDGESFLRDFHQGITEVMNHGRTIIPKVAGAHSSGNLVVANDGLSWFNPAPEEVLARGLTR